MDVNHDKVICKDDQVYVKSADNVTPAIDKVRSTLGKRYRLTVSDGRRFEGTLLCLDKDLNIVLGEAEELNTDGHCRSLGMVMVKDKDLVRAEMETSPPTSAWSSLII